MYVGTAYKKAQGGLSPAPSLAAPYPGCGLGGQRRKPANHRTSSLCMAGEARVKVSRILPSFANLASHVSVTSEPVIVDVLTFASIARIPRRRASWFAQTGHLGLSPNKCWVINALRNRPDSHPYSASVDPRSGGGLGAPSRIKRFGQWSRERGWRRSDHPAAQSAAPILRLLSC